MLHADVTEKIIKAFYLVYNTLGYGFLEKVYENALVIELRKLGFQTDQQQAITVFYNETPVGNYFADIVVNGVVILELKTVEDLSAISVNECTLTN